MREYQARLDARQQKAQALGRLDRQISNARLVSFAAAAILLIAGFAYPSIGPFWFIPPLCAFIGLIVWHARVVEQLDFVGRAAAFYKDGLARCRGLWPGPPHRPDAFGPRDHLYAADLDLFGETSLFERLNAARTRAGEEILARWLCEGAAPDEVLARQAAVQELRPLLDFREDLAVLGHAVRSEVRPAFLRAWVTRATILTGTSTLNVARLLTGLTSFAFLGWLAFGLTVLPLLLLTPIVIAFHRWKGPLAEECIRGFSGPEKDLAVLAAVARRIEAEPFHCGWLSSRRDTLFPESRAASASIATLGRLLAWYEVRSNPLFAPVAYMLLWPFHFGALIERWRVQTGVHVHEWLESIGAIEAAASLSMYAFENPNSVFPEIVESIPPVFEAEGLKHPLMNGTGCVDNELRLGAQPSFYVVSGSNMSGKSTLLRSVGVAAAMAFAGAPVCASRLRISPLRIGASIATHDSIQAGTSRFYAEIQRIRDIVQLARREPVLFLIDEALHGTNSHDRRIGASAILRTLVDAGAIGLVTTHDLALTEPLEQYGPGRAANWHFQDRIEHGKLVFDYTLHPGVVQKSNAIELMRSIGLDV